jgi:hypothetical protein
VPAVRTGNTVVDQAVAVHAARYAPHDRADCRSAAAGSREYRLRR